MLISKAYQADPCSIFIGAPLAFYMMQFWLMDFAYAITPSLLISIFAGVSRLLIAFVITGYHDIKASVNQSGGGSARRVSLTS